MRTTTPRIDWQSHRDRIDLAALVSNRLGPPPGRRGDRGRKLWWNCPFHDDRNPSFCIEPGKPWWRCWGCGEHGDAATFLMKIDGSTFPEALAELTGGSSRTRTALPRPPKLPTPKPPAEASGLPEADAVALVETAVERLWKPEGRDALEHLTGPRGLSIETIRKARLGWTPDVLIPTRDGDRHFRASGIVIPWFNKERLALVKIRQPEDRRPKYAEVHRNPGRLVCYPCPGDIRAGRPLVVVEGEFDALVLGQAVADLAAVVTLGSASSDPDPAILSRFLAATPWFIATDADDAGDKAAAKWPTHAVRVRPPSPWKDWTEAAAQRVNLKRWWSDILAGYPSPPLHTWEDLEAWRWGPALTEDG